MSLLVNCVWFLVLVGLTSAKIGDFITPCDARDPELNKCVLKQADLFYPHLVRGVKEFGILPLDPLDVPIMVMEGIGLSFNITDAKHYGWGIQERVAARFDPNKYHFELDILNKRYEAIGQYQANGRILFLPIMGNGFTNMTFVNLKMKLVCDGIPEQRNGKTYMKVTKVNLTIGDFDKIYIRMDNLFGNKQLSDGMNTFLNENGKEVFGELKPSLDDNMSAIYHALLSRLFAKIPYNQLFTNLG